MRFVGDLDPKVSWVVDQVLRPGDTALDIGSNLGLVSLRMAARVGPTGAVHAFDPQPRMQAYLRKTMDLNPNLPITLHPIGLGPSSDTLQLTIPAHNAGAASLVASVGTTHPSAQTVDVSVEPLDSYAKAAGITNVRMIKMDVEGFEAQVLKGASAFLEENKPVVILLEDNARDAASGQSQALKILQELGYAIYTLPRALFSVRLGKVSDGDAAHDFVAVSPQAPTQLRRKLRIS
ncbi:FkbM family methyltransferase [uncultured Tateyamaria sp.]|uniref:FkbM family methyltransferase n=1 Tax=uncultured Tateyamaria sp. TaxID=455651 RepID=UPI0026089363|nr:FkbM family methyltransferase [uncultured Tateyamaria sp.]